MTLASAARLIAFYLPQFHPIPENDAWWGKGFTEWTNAAKALPLFRGHYQPHVPADLGFYDLRVPETRQDQADMARKYGIEAFCYYHYWFGGRRLLERPFNDVLASGEPDFPFCLCWANQTWTGIWHGAPDRILVEQTYPGPDDHRAHFDTLLPAFADPRHITVDGKPVFLVYRPLQLPDARQTTDFWRNLAVKAGLPGLHLIGVNENPAWNPADCGFDASVSPQLPSKWFTWRQPVKKIRQLYRKKARLPEIVSYAEALPGFIPDAPPGIENYPCLIPNWDNTPRSGNKGYVLHGSSPGLFRVQVRQALEASRKLPGGRRLVFIKSWNEWAEGNHLEPDLKFGTGYLEALQDELARDKAQPPR